MIVNHKEKIVERFIPEYAKVLRKIRVEKGITQREVAKNLGVTHMMISHLENGTRIPKLDLFDNWAHFLGVELKLEIIRSSLISKHVKK